jgi:hypothetical protein
MLYVANYLSGTLTVIAGGAAPSSFNKPGGALNDYRKPMQEIGPSQF